MTTKTRLQVFQGTTPKATRDFLQVTLKRLYEDGHYKRLIIPCAGRFTIPLIARAAGFPASSIVASDISLFSTLVGHHIAGKPLDDLNLRFSQEVLDLVGPFLGTERHAGAVMYAMKWAQLKPGKTFYAQQNLMELERAVVGYTNGFQRQLDAMRAAIGPVDYRIADIFAEIDAAKDDPEAILYANPPGFKNGYSKMFDFGAHLQWEAPPIPEFDPKTGVQALFTKALEASALMIWYRIAKVSEPELPYVVFGQEQKADKVDYCLVNRPDELNFAVSPRKPSAVSPGKWLLLPYDRDIKPTDIIRCHVIPKEQALYYRDLFAHKLGATRAEAYFALSVNNMLFAVFGMSLVDAMRRRTSKNGVLIHEVFGFNVASKHSRLNKLLMLCLTCDNFRRDLIASFSPLAYVGGFRFQTTCLADVPEVKANRGVLKIGDRKKLPNGKFWISYYADFREGTYGDMLKRWLARDGRVTRGGEE